MSILAFTPSIEWSTGDTVSSSKLTAQVENEKYLMQNKIEVGYQNDDVSFPKSFCENFAFSSVNTTITVTGATTPGVNLESGTGYVIMVYDSTNGRRLIRLYGSVTFTKPTTSDKGDFELKSPTFTSGKEVFTCTFNPEVTTTVTKIDLMAGANFINDDGTDITVQWFVDVFVTSTFITDKDFTVAGTIMVRQTGLPS